MSELNEYLSLCNGYYYTCSDYSILFHTKDKEINNSLNKHFNCYFSNIQKSDPLYDIYYIESTSIFEKQSVNCDIIDGLVFSDSFENQMINIHINNRMRRIILITKSNESISFIDERNLFLFRFLRKILLVVLLNDGNKFLHSGCIEYDKFGIGVVGQKFAGKTTCIINLLKNKKVNYIANDKVIINNEFQVLALPIAMGLRYGTILKICDAEKFKLNNLTEDELCNLDKLDYKIYVSSHEVDTLFNTKSRSTTKIIFFIKPHYNSFCKNINVSVLSKNESINFLNSQLLKENDIGESFEYLTLNVLFNSSDSERKELVQRVVPNIYEIEYNENLTNDFAKVIEKLVRMYKDEIN